MNYFSNIGKNLAYFLISAVLVAVGTSILGAPAHAANITVSPPRFEFSAEKGQTVSDTIAVTNGDNTVLTITPSVADFSAEGEAGHASFTQGEDTSSFAMSSWITLPDGPIEIPANDKATIPFSIAVPEGAESGGHFGTIFFSPVVPKEGTIAIQQKVGVLLLVRVAGDVVEQGNLSVFNTYRPDVQEDAVQSAKPTSVFSNFPVAVAVRFTNTGNVHTKPAGTIILKNMLGQVLDRVGEEAIVTSNGAITGIKLVDYLPLNDRSGNVLPNSSRVFLSTWKGYGSQILNDSGAREIAWRGIGFGRYTAELNLSYGDTALPVQAIHFWIIPWMIILPSLAGLIVLIVLIKFWRKHSRERLKRQLREELEQEARNEAPDQEDSTIDHEYT